MITENIWYKTDEDKLIPVYISETNPKYYYVYDFICPGESVTEKRPKVITPSMFCYPNTQEGPND